MPVSGGSRHSSAAIKSHQLQSRPTLSRERQGAEAQHFWDVCADAWQRAANANVDLIEQVLCECTHDQMIQ